MRSSCLTRDGPEGETFVRPRAAGSLRLRPFLPPPRLNDRMYRALIRLCGSALLLAFGACDDPAGADELDHLAGLYSDAVRHGFIWNGTSYLEIGGDYTSRINDYDDVVIRVRDTGIGVPHDKVPYLFDEFYQVNNYERDRSKGFGMGLAICRSLARHIGAEVRLASTGADGSCFEIILSSSAAAAAAAAGAATAGSAGASSNSSGSNSGGAVSSAVAGNRALTDLAGECGATGAGAVGAVGAAGGDPLRPDRGGRPLGAAGDRDDPAAAGLCRV